MRLHTLLVALSALAGSAAAAQAAPYVTGQISLGGYAEAIGGGALGTANGVDFVNGYALAGSPGAAGGLYSYGGGSGTFAGFTCASANGSCGTIQDILAFSSEPSTPSFLMFNTGGTAVSFDLTSIRSVTRTQDSQGGSLAFTADGTINVTGYNPTNGSFVFVVQGNGINSFSATTLAATPVSAAPEPEAWALMLGGVGVLGAVMRRRKDSATA